MIRTPDGRLALDNSTLAATARCSTETVLRHVHGLTSPDERATLRSGSAAHEALATYLTTADPERALAVFRTEYYEWATTHVAGDDRLAYDNLHRILSAWFAANPYHSLPFKVEAAEIGFTYPLGDPGTADADLVFCGRIDAIGTSEHDRATYIVEWKTTGLISSSWMTGFRMDSQLSGYIWAAQQHIGRPVVGAILGAIEFSKLPVSDRKCRDHGVPHSECYPAHLKARFAIIQRTPEELAEWRKTALHLARRYRDLATKYGDLATLHAVRTQGKFHRACQWCFAQDFCAVGRPLERVPQMFVYDPWSPLDVAQPPAPPDPPADPPAA